MAETIIDAGKLLDERAAKREEERRHQANEAHVAGERGPVELQVGRKATARGARAFVAIIVGLGILVALGMTVKAHQLRKADAKASEPKGRVEKRVPPLAVDTRRSLAATDPRLAADGRGSPALVQASTGGVEGLLGRRPASETVPTTEGGTLPPTPIQTTPPAPPGAEARASETPEARRLSRGFGGAGDEGGLAPVPPADAVAASAAPPGAPGKAGGFEEKLEPTELRATSATLMTDRDYWLTQGATLDCVLQTKIISTAPGMVSCFLTRNAYSTNGRVVLLDRGTKLVGRYQAGVQQGEARIFVVWTRAETPNGVIVNLDSPGTGALGEAGVGGFADTHFLDRFGAAILVSLIQSGTSAAAARIAGPSRGTNVILDGPANATNEVVAKTYENTTNMPPTIYVNQGDRVSVFVARDLNFRSVYGLEPVHQADE